MTTDLTLRLGEIGTVLAEKMPRVLDATVLLLESLAPAVDAARLNRYSIQHQLEVGGHAEVLLGVARGADGFHRPVAIKRVKSDLANQERFLAMLAAEAHHVSQLSHPNVVSILDFEFDPERRPYLVMEYVDGVNLEKFIATGPLPHSVPIFIVRELLSGLGYIHGARDRGQGRDGLVHCDVTPRNVLLSWEGEVKLADFGVAQVLDVGTTVGANAGAGTRGYLSPEQARCEGLDGRSDLYAVGIVLWELLALHRLRAGLPSDVGATITFHAIRRPSEYQQGVPADLEAVAMRLLTYDREQRYQTAELAAHDLMRCQDVPRDGRAELAHLLEERFPRTHREGLLARPPRLPSNDPRTVTGPETSTNALPRPMAQENGQPRTGMPAPKRWRWRTRTCFVLFALLLVLAAILALFVSL